MNSKNQWIIASNNAGKIAEINNLLASFNISLIAQQELNIPEAEEPAPTFIENALIKARHASSLGKLPALADDSGLIVPCLNGEPGVKSARYAGTRKPEDNIVKLISELKQLNTQQHEFPAFFYCVIVVIQHEQDPSPIICTGKWHGNIILEPRGENGFGYDPVFYDPTQQLTAAEMTSQQKQGASHRGKAIRQLISELGASISEQV